MTQLVRQQPGGQGPFGLPARRATDHLGPEEAFSLRKYLEVLGRRRWLIAGAVATVLAVTTIQVLTITPLYQATATLQVDPDQSKVLPYEDIGTPTRRSSAEELNTELAKLSSDLLAQRVVERLDLADNPGFTQPIKRGFFTEASDRALAAVKRLLRGESPRRSSTLSPRSVVNRVGRYVSTSKVRGTRLIQVHFQSPDRQVAAEVTNAFAEIFIEENLDNKFRAVTRASTYLQSQLEDLRGQFEESEQKLLEYARSRNIVDLTERTEASRRKLSNLLDTQTRLEEELTTQGARYEAIRKASVDSLPSSIKDEALRSLETRLSEMKGTLAGLSAQYGSQWPAVKELRSKIADVERQLVVEKQRATERARQELEVTRLRYSRLRADVQRQRQVVEQVDADSFEYDLLKREAETNKELYEGVLTRLKQAGVAAGMKSANIRITAPATVPTSQYFPNKTQSLLLALILGISLGVGLAFLAEFLDNTLKRAEDVTRHLSLPALGVIPKLTANGHGWSWNPFRRVPRRSNPLPVLVDSDSDRLRARAREAYRALRTSILLSNSEKPPQTILVTSAVPGEGKSTTAVNTAIALAQTDSRTLLIDMDLRKPKLSQLLSLPVGSGLSGFLSGNTDLSSRIRETSVPNLFLVGAGPTPPNPPELLGSKRMATGFTLLKEYFNHIVIDSPPAMELSDALIISPHTDGVILVARGGRTPRAAVARTSLLFQNVGAKILGVLINDIDSESSGDGNYYYYRYGGYDSYFTRAGS